MRVNETTMDSSSSDTDDEAALKLKEAVAQELTSYMNVDRQESKIIKKKTPKSIRNQIYNGHSINENGLNTTPEFRRHVANKLSCHLDSVLEIKTCGDVCTERKSQVLGGIKLLLTSAEPVVVGEIIQPRKSPASNSLADCSDSDSDKELRRFSEVVVSGTDILMGGEGAFTKNRENRTCADDKKSPNKTSKKRKSISNKSKTTKRKKEESKKRT